jgi:DNA-binding NarL/FixJ family response regulator
LDDFLKDEENETMKYIDDIEGIVSSTKLVLKGLVSGELDYNRMKEKLLEIESELTQDCCSLQQDISSLTMTDKNIESTTLELQKQETLTQTFALLSAQCQQLLTLLGKGVAGDQIAEQLGIANANAVYQSKHRCMSRWKELFTQNLKV